MAGRPPAALIEERFHFVGVGRPSDQDRFCGREYFRSQPEGAVRDERIAAGFQVDHRQGVRMIEEVVRFVDDDPVGQAGPASVLEHEA